MTEHRDPTFVRRAEVTLAGGDEGVRRISWEDLIYIEHSDWLAFQEALSIEAERRRLEVTVYEVQGPFEGIEVRWRPAESERGKEHDNQ